MMARTKGAMARVCYRRASKSADGIRSCMTCDNAVTGMRGRIRCNHATRLGEPCDATYVCNYYEYGDTAMFPEVR